jgi:DNA-binding PadR family transcriptional regulator
MSDRAAGEFETLVLLALVRLGEEAYGVTVRQEIEERTGRAVTSGAVYTALERLESRGYVRSWTGEPTSERGGRRKRHFAIEAAGAVALQRSREALAAMSRGLGGVIARMAEDAGHGPSE